MSRWLLPLFARAGYVSDTDRRLTGEHTVYRGTFSDDPRGGISWTLDETKARWFAGRLSVGGTVWQATVNAAEILGYFVERDEAEVIVHPAALRDLTQI